MGLQGGRHCPPSQKFRAAERLSQSHTASWWQSQNRPAPRPVILQSFHVAKNRWIPSLNLLGVWDPPLLVKPGRVRGALCRLQGAASGKGTEHPHLAATVASPQPHEVWDRRFLSRSQPDVSTWASGCRERGPPHMVQTLKGQRLSPCGQGSQEAGRGIHAQAPSFLEGSLL